MSNNSRNTPLCDEDYEDDEDFELLNIGTKRFFNAVESVRTYRQTNIYISEGIGAPHLYVDLLTKLRLATPTDVIYLHLNTPGGRLDTGVQIIHAMNECAGRVVAVLDGSVSSMGALIFLAAQEFIVHDFGRMMLHNYSGGTVGKGNEQLAALKSTIEWYGDICHSLCIPFLDQHELDAMLAGTDIWLSSDEIKLRLQNVVEAAEEENRLLLAEQQDAEDQAVLKRIQAAQRKAEKAASKKAKIAEIVTPPQTTDA